MLILLPPSEGKAAPRRGRPLDLASLSFPVLHGARAEVLDALVSLCTTAAPAEAAAVLGLGPTQADEVVRNARLATAPTARTDRVYTGVLYETLDLGSLDAAARRRATGRLAIVSGVFGLLRPGDRVPAYRLSGQVSLPGLGPVATHWGRHLAPAVEEAARDGLVVDLRSSAYSPFWRPAKGASERVVTLRVLHEVDGRRKVVSHFNKATKGRIVRDLLTDGSSPRRPGQLADLLAGLGWKVEAAQGAGRPTQLDVVVSEL
ncbi:MAG TPA: peroxide stress protein YaaA [Marmoricola sp.]|nr:peroxide stress protein YaaA [Marmoricola sp.]